MKWLSDALIGAGIAVCLAAIALTWGDPDIIDGLVYWLSDGALFEQCDEGGAS